MELHKQHRHSSSLPRTSRVNEKIIEYYTKFGQDRDLEKFMRLYSPSSSKSCSHSKTSSRSKSGSRSKSRVTTSTTTTTASSCGDFSEDEQNCGAIRRLFLLNNPECDSTSESNKSVLHSSPEQIKKVKKIEHIIPIRLEEDENQITKERVERISFEDADTPVKAKRTQAMQTQTPDSVTKTHKRLEWDSLGDVGYMKSMSTSNISILERSLLREFFQDGSTTSSSHKATANASEGDLQKKLRKEIILDYKRLKKQTSTEHKIYKKPLASSTLVEAKALSAKADNTRSKYSDKATTTNSLQFQEKLRRTSLQQSSTKQTQAIQVDMSNTSNSPNTCSSTTTNSFEYCCTALSNPEEKAGLSISQQFPQDFVASIQELISSRRRQSNKRDKQEVQQEIDNDSLTNFEIISDSLKKAINENKENTINTSQFDLGVQLLCSLIDAKSLDSKEKKQLVRDIVKRITQLGPSLLEDRKNSSEKATLKKSKHEALSDQIDLTEEPSAQNLISSSYYSSEKLINIEVFPSGSNPSKSSSQRTTSATATLALSTKQQKQSEASNKGEINKTMQTTNSSSVEKTEQLKSDEVLSTIALPNIASLLPTTSMYSTAALPSRKAQQKQAKPKIVQTTNKTPFHGSELLSNVDMVSRTALSTVSSSEPTTSKKAAAALAARIAKQKPREAQTMETIHKTVQATNSTSSYKSEHLLNKEVFPTSSHENASKNATAAIVTKNQKQKNAVAPIKEKSDKTAQAANNRSEHLLNVEAALTTKIAKQKQLELLAKSSSSKPEFNEINNELLIVIQSPTDLKTSSDSHNKDEHTSSTIDTHTTASSSKEVITLKAVNNNTNTNSSDADATMDEWLNPLTQSEIEYEKKKLELAGKTNKNENQKLSSKIKQQETEREVQLNWIDTEIQRLESLKHLLLEENAGDSKRNIAENDKNVRKNSLDVYKDKNEVDKIYDTVYSDPDKVEDAQESVLTKSGEHKLKEIEVIIEQSNEDIVNFRTKTKRTKERKKETQIYYGKPTKEQEKLADHSIQPTGKPLFRRMRETVITNEDQILSITDELTKGSATQRSKIDTPSGSNGSESVGSFVKQRKREFIEHYKNKKKSHYEALQQQQQQATEAAQAAATGHYSVPRTAQHIYGMPPHTTQLHPNYCQDQMQPHHIYWQQHMVPPPPPPPPPPVRERRISCSASAGLTSVQSTKTQTHSSSSMFGISSEISIPMGSNVTSSSTTTTHQYDDVFVGGGIVKATSESITTTSHKARSALAPFKPKSIAYVISFDADSVVLASQASVAQDTEILTLQDYLERSRPKFCQDTKERKAILNQIQAMRQERERELRDIVDNANENSLDRKLLRLPPPPTRHTRIFPTKEMKALTNKHYARLPEVLEKQQREREERRRRGNRIIRDVFNSRLQKRVRKGKLSLNHSRTVI